MAAILYSDVRKGMVIVGEDGQLNYCVNRDLRTPGNLPSKLTLRLKNLKTGLVNDVRVHPEDKVQLAHLDTRPMQYLYKDGDDYVFMDQESFDQITLSGELVGDLIPFLKENDTAKVVSHEGRPLSLELPTTVTLKVVETDPVVKGATAVAQYKPAVCETGLKVNVPGFIERGETISIDTRTGEYQGRVKE